jgi:hypothetical protein
MEGLSKTAKSVRQLGLFPEYGLDMLLFGEGSWDRAKRVRADMTDLWRKRWDRCHVSSRSVLVSHVNFESSHACFAQVL